jgi:hypothetical protein
MIRLLLDPMMVRRPLLEPNLTVGGMTFLGISLLIFLMANVVNSKMTPDDLAGARGGTSASSPVVRSEDQSLATWTRPLLHLLRLSTQIFDRMQRVRRRRKRTVRIATGRTMAILSHMAVVVGMVLIGYRHFDNIRTGIAAATLYLLLPYTAQLTGRVDHVLPAALLVWAVESYRRPLISGMLMGLAIGVIYYPAFLLPLWLGFYWQRGLLRFSLGVVITLALLVGSLAFTSDSMAAFWMQVQQMFGWTSLSPKEIEGFWSFHILEVIAIGFGAVVAFSFSLARGRVEELNVDEHLAPSAGTQFWHPHGGGLYMAWYLPLVLLTIFRPNLEDRVALSVLGGWFPAADPGWRRTA